MSDTEKQNELIKHAQREAQLSVGIIGEIAKHAQSHPTGLPLEMVKQSLHYAKEHLTEARDAIRELEEIAALEPAGRNF